jgi:hypothetical protein
VPNSQAPKRSYPVAFFKRVRLLDRVELCLSALVIYKRCHHEVRRFRAEPQCIDRFFRINIQKAEDRNVMTWG